MLFFLVFQTVFSVKLVPPLLVFPPVLFLIALRIWAVLFLSFFEKRSSAICEV